ncbi:hypothetical protein KSS87_002270 [Heliosperma pusillum]|nr:hypothetical protein KSS87_002270 [Heliosperma pusillum]
MELNLTRPDDWHLHLRDGDLLAAVAPYRPPVTTTAAAINYRESILKVLPDGSDFNPLMTLYLTDKMDPDEIKLARDSGVVYAVKLYPAGATTNSQDGVTDLFGKCLPVLEEMAKQNMPLLVSFLFINYRNYLRLSGAEFGDAKIDRQLVNVVPEVHGEVTDPNVDIFDREKHLTLNRNSLFQGGLQPHNYCLPVLKRETHRQTIVTAVTSGSKQYFLGTDSAPHERQRKECSCGCAGIFNAPVALSLYAKIFEEAGALDKLEAFTSFNGPDFYGLPRNTSKVKLARQQWKVPERLTFSFGEIIPMWAGETLDWHPCS